jgi:hypothetical protein
MADWWSPLISAAAGLTGVWAGSSLTLARERRQRQYDFARRQLEEFYSPLCALREEIRAKGEIRAEVSAAAGAAWTAAFAGVIDPETKKGISDERTPTLEKSIAYDNEQLRREIIPAFKRMCELFQEKLWLVEESTRKQYPVLMAFAEVWDRYLAQAVPGDVLGTAGHSEQSLIPLYEDADNWRRTLMDQLRGG